MKNDKKLISETKNYPSETLIRQFVKLRCAIFEHLKHLKAMLTPQTFQSNANTSSILKQS